MIVRTKGGNREVRSFALTDMVRWGVGGGLRSLQSQFGEKELRGLPAIHRAVRLRAEAIAALRLYCWRGEGPQRERVDGVWQSQLFADPSPNECQTRFGFWETVEESLSYRGNAFIWKNTDGGKIVDWWALHPDQIKATFGDDGSIRYEVKVAPGYVDPVGRGTATYTVDYETLIHIRGHGEGGQLMAPSPVQVFRTQGMAMVGRQRHQARMYRRGIAGQVAVIFPQGIGKEAADQWREAYRANYEGTEGETTLVMGGGADIKPIGLSPEDIQFVEMEKLTVYDASWMMGVPANLLGITVNEKGTPNLEQDLMTWLRFGLGPEIGRIESAIYADETLFGNARTYPGFDTDDFVRGDLATEAQILQTDVQTGILLPDEARAMKGLPPLPGGAGMIPQIVPVGGTPNPKPNTAPEDVPDGADADPKE